MCWCGRGHGVCQCHGSVSYSIGIQIDYGLGLLALFIIFSYLYLLRISKSDSRCSHVISEISAIEVSPYAPRPFRLDRTPGTWHVLSVNLCRQLMMRGMVITIIPH